MEDELNTTYIIFDGYVELHKYRYVYFSVMFIVYILIICCNFTIVCLIWIHQNLHEPMYIFIAALLLNSVLFSTTIYPKLLNDFLSVKPMISYSTCLIQFFFIYTLASSDISLLAAMAYDRYVSICRPLQYTTIMTKTTMSVSLVLAWLLPATHVIVLVKLSADMTLCDFTLKGIFCNNSLYKLGCGTSRVRTIFGIFVLINTGLLPMLFILFTYMKIFVISYRSSKEMRTKAAQTCFPHLLVLISFFCLCAYDVIIVRIKSDFPKTARMIMTLQVITYHSLFNPIIYGLKVKEIYKHLKRLFCSTALM
ncbi:olfactory receptor 142-like [Sphaeramia orbicularis]|uniref:Olfactory receptor n=1 Tax=Sphaeramia orbicularis TaxID=375764 RepID=A0A673BKQ6_9TELE|nr:olfactory receptor 142-like [Sphaeramia orbicularis]